MITNTTRLSPLYQLAVEALQKRYKASHEMPSDLSVSQLVQPVRISELRKRHEAELTEDVTELVPSLFGSAMHLVLELAKDGLEPGRFMVEKRFYTSVLGWKISGQVDVAEFRDGGWIVQDHKFVKVWEYIYGAKADKVAQVNSLAFLMRMNGFTVTGTELHYGFTDWSPSDFKRMKDYPPKRAVVVPVETWEPGRAADYVRGRVSEYQAARKALDADLPVCTPDERWQPPMKFAHMKRGRQSAITLYDSREDAEAAILHGNEYVEERPSTPRRCEAYCSVGSSGFCSWWNEHNPVVDELVESLKASLTKR
jgi:hypothetical protein